MERIRYGMVGGAIGSYIGEVHMQAARMNPYTQLCAGSFSRRHEVSLKTAGKYGLDDTSRVYPTYQEMAEAESARPDGIHVVIIATPNSSHFEIAKMFLEHGIHVMCDKPLTRTVAESEELVRLAREKGLLLGLTYGYTGYPVIRQAREMIEQGMIGDILHVKVSHPEDWVIDSLPEEKPAELPWRFDPSIAGDSLCTADLGTHAEQLLVQFTGLHVDEVLAQFDTYPKYLDLETNVSALLRLENGATGQLWASQIATGSICAPEAYAIGTKGALRWTHEMPGKLFYTKKGGSTEILEAGKEYMSDASNRLAWVSAGHNEGFFEAFANIYRNYFASLRDILEGKTPSHRFPDANDGLHGLKFVEACLKSQKGGGIWVKL